MARVEGICKCEKWGCTVHYTYNGPVPLDADGRREKTGSTKIGWIDAITGICRPCEIEVGDRWGHNTAKAEEATPEAGERVI